MSDAKQKTSSSAPSGAAGRMLSRARRQALSRNGKAGAGQVPKVNPNISVGIRPDMHAAMPVRTEPLAAASETHGDSASEGDCGCTHAAEAQTLEAVCALVETEPAALGVIAPEVRQLCQQRRQALSNQGKLALRQYGKGGSARRIGGKANANNGLSGRAASRARRQELCVNGRGDHPACRPSGRVRATSEKPLKVEQGSTMRGNPVTGTQVERSHRVTGIEAGSCREITGTEYIGAEQYGEFCATIPAPGPAKVASSSTSRGQRVSGTEVGRSAQVTGDEQGSCKAVTGNEYISSEQFEYFCASKPAPGVAKVATFSTRSGQPVSGTEVGRSQKVTGDEPGACLKLTGSQYYQPDQSGSVCQGSGVPHKVSVMSTVRERPVTGTEVAASERVTGSEYGACSNVTGTEYAGLQQYQACNREPALTPEKVVLSRTWRDQTVSGTAVEHSSKVTGDEYGGCQPISGTEYIGPGQYTEFCTADSLTVSGARVATHRGAAGASITGVGLAADKVTGRGRGEAQHVSGSAYSDDARSLPSGEANANRHPLTRGPADRSKITVASAAPAPVAGSFSVVTPARSAQTSQLSRITGTAYGAQGRITGPVNLAAGLVSGTPEFRYREEGYATSPAAQEVAQPLAASPSRITGEGREEGFAITGAVWRRGGSTTGTEGTSAARRNPTQRGDQRSMAMQVLAMKERDHMPVPPSRVTGSSGNAATGSTITYSGGARG